MRRRLTAVLLSGMLGLGASAVAFAHPGPHHGNNAFGLCTAYFAGSETGRENKRQAPPFQALEQAAEDNDQTVEEWCAENGQHPGQGNGQGNS